MENRLICPQFLVEFRLSVPDPYLIFFISAGLFTAYSYLQENNFTYLLLASVSFAFATLAKGPVAIALPGICLLTWIIIKKKWKLIFTWKIVPAIILFLAITLPWYLAVDKATNHAWTRGFFIEHNINRFSDPAEGHGGFFIVTMLFVLIGLLPFTSFIGEVAKSRKQVFTKDLVKFSGIVVLAFVVFFSVSSTKLPNYPMPCYPFAAIVLGYYLSAFINNQVQQKKYPLFILFVFSLIIPFAGYFALQQEKEAAALKSLSLFLLVAPIGLLLIILLWKNINAYKKIVSIAIAYCVFNMAALQFIYPAIYSQNPVAKTISIVKQHPLVYSYMIYNAGYNFYLNKPVTKFSNVNSLQAALIKNPSAIVISRSDYDEALQKLSLKKVAQHHDLFELPTTVLYVTATQP